MHCHRIFTVLREQHGCSITVSDMHLRVIQKLQIAAMTLHLLGSAEQIRNVIKGMGKLSTGFLPYLHVLVLRAQVGVLAGL